MGYFPLIKPKFSFYSNKKMAFILIKKIKNKKKCRANFEIKNKSTLSFFLSLHFTI